MAWAYITEKQVGCELWYFAVLHVVMMRNQFHGRLVIKLANPFDLVHNTKPDSKPWFEIFSIGYFNHNIDNT